MMLLSDWLEGAEMIGREFSLDDDYNLTTAQIVAMDWDIDASPEELQKAVDIYYQVASSRERDNVFE